LRIIIIIIIIILHAIIITAKSQGYKELRSQMTGREVEMNLRGIIPLCQSITDNTHHTNTTLKLNIFVFIFYCMFPSYILTIIMYKNGNRFGILELVFKLCFN